jgi:hypothetical protein
MSKIAYISCMLAYFLYYMEIPDSITFIPLSIQAMQHCLAVTLFIYNRAVVHWKFYIIYSILFFWGSSRVSAGPILFSINVSPVYHTAQSFTISHQQYADDIVLDIALSALQPHSGIQCLYTLSQHVVISKRPLNASNSSSNSILFSTRQRPT